MNFLFCSAGRRCELLKDLRRSMGDAVKIVAADASKYAPALYFSDEQYVVPGIDSPNYISALLEICEKESIDAITTCIDPEIPILARYRAYFEDLGVTVLCPAETTAALCLDKYEFSKKLSELGLPCVPTYGSLKEVLSEIDAGRCSFPVFVKPRRGSGSVGARKVENADALALAFAADSTLIAQPYLGDALDLDADVYVDTVSRQAVSAFSKKKLSTTIGGANKTVSFKDQALLELIKRLSSSMEFYGPMDVDFFKVGDEYLISEVNPRFGGAYIHAFGAGVDFFKLIANNVAGVANSPEFMNYDEGVYMLMYDSAVIGKLE